MATSELAVSASPIGERASPAQGIARPWRWIGTLFFAEGLPATVVGTLAAIFLKHLEVPNARIAVCVSGLMLPWTLRPLWSPLLEVFATKRFFVIALEGLIALCLAAIALVLTSDAGPSLCILLFAAIALCAATHDMAADGLFIRSLPAEAQPRYLGWLSVAFNAGKLTAQGLLVVVVGRLSLWRGAHFAWQVAFGILAAITAGLALYHRHALPNDEPVSPAPRSLRHMRTTTAQVVTSFFTNRGNAALLALIVVYRLAEGQVVRIAPLFLMDSRQVGGLGLTTSQLGVIYGGLGGIMLALGALMGGSLATRIGERRAVIPLCLCFNVPALVYLLLAGLAPSLPVIAAAIVLEQMAYGVGSIGLKLAVLSAAKGPYETAHCAFAGGLAGIGAIVAGMLSGTVQSTLGYLGFFAWALVAAGAPLIVAWICYRREA